MPGIRSGVAALAAAASLIAGAGLASATFGTGGVETTNFGGVDGLQAIAQQKDGRIVAAGSTTAGATSFDLALARYGRDGVADNTFSGDGKLIHDLGGFDGAHGVAVQKGGKIVVAGGTDALPADGYVARFTAAGDVDATFAGGGLQPVDFGVGPGAVFGMAQSKKGAIGVVASFESGVGVGLLKPNGAWDTSFSGDGRAMVDLGPLGSADSIAFDREGRILIGGSRCIGGGMCGNGDAAIARLTTKGKLDKTFSKDGRAYVDLGNSEYIADIEVDAKGRVLAAGSAYGEGGALVLRYLPNGKPDKSFSGDGQQIVKVGTNFQSETLAVQKDGKIVIAGGAELATLDMALARLTGKGKLDRKFSVDGKQTLDLGAGEGIREVVLQPIKKASAAKKGKKGKKRKKRKEAIVVGGGTTVGGNDFVIARFLPNGQLDD